MEDKQIQPNTDISGSLTTPAGVGSNPVSVAASAPRPPRRSSRSLLRVIVPVILVLLLIGGGVAAYVASRNRDESVENSLQPSANYDVQNIPLSDFGDASTIGLNTTQSLSVNGQLRANGSLLLTPTSRPQNAVKGQIYFDTQTNTPYVFDGTNFVSMSVSQAVQSIGGQVGNIALGPGLLLSGGQLSLDGGVLEAVSAASAGAVTSVQGQTGAVAFSSGNGISINGTTIANTGVVSIAAASPQLSVTQGSGGAYNIGIVGSLATANGTAGQIAVFDSASNLVDSTLSQVGSVIVASNNLQVAGTVQTNTLTNLSSGTDLAVNAGSDEIVFTSSGINFRLPTSGSATQTICTVGMGCSGGGGSFVELQPSGAQIDAGSGASISVNNTGGGELLHLQGNTTDVFVVGNNGDTNIAGDLSVAGTINGATITGGAMSGGSVTGGSLSATAVNGLNVSASAVSSTGALTITAANNANLSLNTSGTGVLTLGGSSVQGAGALTIGAGGTNQDLTLAGSGTGNVVIQVPEFHNANGATYVFNPSDNGAVSATICTSVGNCIGSGGAVGGSGSAGTIAVWTGSGFTLGNSLLSQSGSVVTVAGDLVATNLQGNGSSITNVNAAQLNGQAASYYTNASNIGTGTLSSDRLAADVAQTDQATNFGVSLSVNGNAVCTTAGNCAGTGAGVGGSGTAGTIAVWDGVGFTLSDSLISQDTSGPNGEVTIDGDVIADSFSGNGAGLTNVDAVTLNGQLPAYYLNAGNLNAGTLNDARLSANVAKYNDTIAAFLNGGSFGGTVSGSDAVGGSDFVTLDQLNAAIGGVGGGVTSLNTLAGDLILQGTVGQITIGDNGTDTLTLALDSAVTLQGNVVNAANGLVKLDGSGLLPAVNGSLLTNVNAATLQGQAGSYYLDLGNATGTLNIARIADASLTNAKLANSSLTVTAGNGLINGGLVSLGGTVTLNAGAGDGISVAADAIAVDSTVCRTSGNCVGGGGGGAVGGSGTAGTIAVWDGTGFSLTDSILSQDTGDLIVAGNAVIEAAGTDQDLTLQGNGTGSVVIDTPEFLNGAGASYVFDTGDTSGTYEVCTTAGNCLGGGSGGVTGSGTVGTIPVWSGTSYNLADSLVSQAGSVVTVTGSQTVTTDLSVGGDLTVTDDLSADAITATSFSGDGASLTNLNASNVATGTLADGRLSSNVTLQGNTINAANGLVKLNASTQLPAVDGSLLTNVNAALLNGQAGSYYLDLGNATGNLSMARIVDGSIGNAELTNSSITINTSGGIAGGTVALGSSLSLSLQNTGVTANTYGSASSVAQFTVASDGRISSASSVAIAIDATQITSGVIASARLSGSYTGITGVGALDAGSITSNFGSIDTGADPVTTTGTITAGTFNATTGGYQTDGTTRISDGGALQNITGYTQTSGNFDASASGGTFSTSTGAVTLGGAATANSTLNVVGAATLQNALNVTGSTTLTGSLSLLHGADYSTTGTSNNVNFGTGAVFRLTGASAQTITGITGGTDGRMITLVNAAGQTAIISNNSGSSLAANRITTGTGADISLYAGGSVSLVYDSVASLWRVIAATSVPSASAGFVSLQGSTPGTPDTGNFNISGTGIASVLQASTAMYTQSLDRANAGTLTIAGTNATTINVASNAATHTINIGTGGGASTQTISIGSTLNSSGLQLSAGSGNINMDTISAFVTIDPATGVFVIDNGTTQILHVTAAGLTTVKGSLAVDNSATFNAGVTIAGSTVYTTPGGFAMNSRINIPNYTLPNNGAVIGLGIDDTSPTSARGILVADERNVAHQASIGVMSPDESGIIGMSWDGSNSVGYLKTQSTSDSVGIRADTTDIALFGASSITLSQSTTVAASLLVQRPSNSTTSFQVQNASAAALLTADTTNMQVVIGNSGNTVTLSANGITLAGTARHAKTIRLAAEYSGAVLDADGTNNTGTMTSALDLTNRMNYYKWTTAQGTNQDYDIAIQVPIPQDFSDWATSSSLTITTYTSNTTNGTILLEARDSASGVECNFLSVTPGSTGTWTTNTSTCALTLSGSTYTPGDYMTLRIRMQSPTSGDVRVGNITLNYLSNR